MTNTQTKKPFDYLSHLSELSVASQINLARHFGTAWMQADIATIIDFLKTYPTSDENKLQYWNEDIASKFFIATMYSYFQRKIKTKSSDISEKQVLFEEVLQKLYDAESRDKEKNSNSIQKQIENLLGTDFTSTGSFEYKLKNIIKRDENAFANINFNQLQIDMCYWNKKSLNSSRNKWARKLFNYKQENEITDETEEK